MTAIDRTPTNLNYLSPLNFRFLIKRAPHIEFFVQQVNLPGINLKPVDTMNPFVKIPYPGDHIDYKTLSIDFKVDEELQNYLEIHNWIKALGKPEDYEGYREIQEKKPWTGEGIYSDITVSILSNQKTHNYEATFVDAHPIELSDLVFKTTDESVNYIQASAVFRYSYYDILKT